ncbi:MAG: DNA polymerase [Candidatus Campbellbacteria bacterium]|nr:DNA polymerase [Candidatus Campbellbacteria bacterium]
MAKKETKKEIKRLVLLDTHAIIHRAYHALPDFASATGEPTGALYGLSAMLLKMVTELKPDYIVAAYDLPKPTYRHEAFAGYKATRVKAEDDLIQQIQRSRDVLEALSIPLYECEGFEADDVLGTIVEQMKKRDDVEIIITSGDMDTLQLVEGNRVRVFTLRKGMHDTILYGEKDVKTRFGFVPKLLPDYKGLRGDPSDNIPGIVGIGEKTATTLVTTFGSLKDIYAALKKDEEKVITSGVTARTIKLLQEGKEDAEFSKMLATIRRDVPISFTLPPKPWKETLDLTVVMKLFTELGFRSLVSRLKEQFGRSEKLFEDTPEPTKEVIPEKDFEEACLGLWLLNSDMTSPSEEDLLAYAKTESLTEARTKILTDVAKEGLTTVLEQIEKPLTPVLKKMTATGIRLDSEYLKELSRDYHSELDALARRIYQHAGGEFNINSPRQLGDVLFEKMGLKGGKKTATGQRSTRESELQKLVDTHPIINEILEHRELQKLLSTYIDAFPSLIGDDGRLHTTFMQTGTTTGRLSSQNPNLQNIPIRTELGRAVRGAFVAEKGYALVAFDYSQIELRIAAIMSRDEKLVKTFHEGGDIHTTVAAEIFNVAPEDVTADMRRTTKVINFGVLYGMGANALAQTAKMPRSDAQKYLAEYEKTFIGLRDYISKAKGEVRKKGYTETLFGRRRRLSAIRSPLPFMQAEAERQAVNAPIQGTSADIIKIAMIRADEHITENKLSEDVRLVLQIHDELIFEVREEKVAEIVPIIKNIMEKALPADKAGGVPILTEASSGKRWSEMKRVSTKSKA